MENRSRLALFVVGARLITHCCISKYILQHFEVQKSTGNLWHPYAVKKKTTGIKLSLYSTEKSADKARNEQAQRRRFLCDERAALGWIFSSLVVVLLLRVCSTEGALLSALLSSETELTQENKQTRTPKKSYRKKKKKKKKKLTGLTSSCFLGCGKIRAFGFMFVPLSMFTISQYPPFSSSY